MSLNSLNLQDLSILRQAYNASEGHANALLEQLAPDIKSKIQALVAGSNPLATTPEQKRNLAIKSITIDFIGRQEHKIKNKIYGIFFDVCQKPITKDSKWGEHHFADDDKIDQLLQAVERAETIRILDDWAKESTKKRVAVQRIIACINNNREENLDLRVLELDTLPDVFMNSNLVKLRELNLGYNQLQSLPESIVNLVNLSSLILGGNQLQSLPGSIDKLVELQILDLGANQLQSLPESIDKLVNLQILHLSQNQLQKLPDSIDKLRGLQKLNVSFNQLQELPDSIVTLNGLMELDLCYNQFHNLPDSISDLENLQILHLPYNQLQSMPDTIHLMKKLRWLDLRSNHLVDLPDNIVALPSECTVNLENAGLSSQVLEKLRSACSEEEYRGPMIHFSISEDRSNFSNSR